jgi:hypothetical protein
MFTQNFLNLWFYGVVANNREKKRGKQITYLLTKLFKNVYVK